MENLIRTKECSEALRSVLISCFDRIAKCLFSYKKKVSKKEKLLVPKTSYKTF